MNERERIALGDRLRALPAETEWFELDYEHLGPPLVLAGDRLLKWRSGKIVNLGSRSRPRWSVREVQRKQRLAALLGAMQFQRPSQGSSKGNSSRYQGAGGSSR